MPSIVEDLAALERSLATQPADAIAVLVKSAATRLRESSDNDELNAIGKQIFAMGPTLFSLGRSHDVLPIVLALHERAADLALGELPSRTASFCGILFADTGDFSSSLDYQSFALKSAEQAGDIPSVSRAWNNIGLAFAQSGHQAQAWTAFERATEFASGIGAPTAGRFTAHTNLASLAYTSRETKRGLQFALLSQRDLECGSLRVDPLSVMLFHRNFVRLYIQDKNLALAESHFAQIHKLATAHPSERAAVMVQTLAAELDHARGAPDLALTRLEAALTRSRISWLTLRDTLATSIRLEAAIGLPGRALIRLRELSEILHRRNVGHANQLCKLAVWRPHNEANLPGFDGFVTNILRPQLDAPNAPEHWNVLARLAIGNSVQIDGTGAHGLRVAVLAELLAIEIGFSVIEAIEIGLAAQLHDIGQAYGHENLFRRHDLKVDATRPETRDHAEAGWTILADDQHPRIMMARECAKYHHSWWSGAGYPASVAGLSIPLHARICAVADAFDALLCEHVADNQYAMRRALDETSAMSGTRLEPKLVDAFSCALRREIRNEGFDLDAANGLQELHHFIESYSQSRDYI
ncbi:MAG: HD-GYP domain-containing protein [Betaproteobacteria bacterium]